MSVLFEVWSSLMVVALLKLLSKVLRLWISISVPLWLDCCLKVVRFWYKGMKLNRSRRIGFLIQKQVCSLSFVESWVHYLGTNWFIQQFCNSLKFTPSCHIPSSQMVTFLDLNGKFEGYLLNLISKHHLLFSNTF